MQQKVHNLLKKDGRVVIHGFYGVGNLGDEAILSAMLNQISTIQNVKPVIFSINPVETRKTHSVSSVNPNTKHSIVGYYNLIRAGVYILGGGGLIKDYGESYSSIENMLSWLSIATRIGLKSMIWSVGTENLRFARSEKLVRELLNKVDAITVRDPNSKKRLEEIGIHNYITVTADPAVLLVNNYSKKRVLKKPPHLIVCLRHWYKYGFNVPDYDKNEKLLDSVAKLLDYMINNWNAEIELIPFREISYDDDREIAEMILSRMRKKNQVTIHNHVPRLDEIVNLISKADLLVGMRLHSIILSTSLGIPTIALSYMPKVRDYMSYINQDHFCFDIEDIDRVCLDERIEKIINNYEEISAQLVLAISNLSTRLLDNIKILSKLLKQ